MSIVASFMVPHPPMIVPAVGKGSEAEITATTHAYEQVADEIAALKPETIIISSPHSVMYADYFHISPGKGAKGSFRQFRAPEVSFSETYDTELVSQLENLARTEGLPAGTLGERDPSLDHGTMVPLYFIRQKYSEGKIVRIGLSGLPLTDHYRLGRLVREAAERLGRRAVYVASGDLSHKLQSYGPYGYAEEGPQYDRRIMDVCGRAAFGELFGFSESFCEKAAECGHRSFVIMAGVWDGIRVKATALSHEDVTGVGYGICSFYPEGPDESRHFLDLYLAEQEQMLTAQKDAADAYVRLARSTVESFVIHRKIPKLPKDLPAELLHTKAGAFVSIHEHGRLRGCIGTFLPTAGCLGEEIIQNAVSACSRDPRFDPVTKDELKYLEINVDVLSAPEPIDSPAQLDVRKYGVIVTAGSRRGLLLPDLDGVDTVEQQIDIARRKAGIGKQEKISLQRFEVVRHK
ncbi:MAG: AmmeMemoRadiSam system protein A [Lachnospiraceae bacterium]|nr:AmmeMemoRadiSam system protein A [Lachnospiraceae bacterium]